MKTPFSLVCPHCKRSYALQPREAVNWYQNHVTECEVGRYQARMSLAEFFEKALAGFKIRAAEHFRLMGRVFMVLRGRDGEVTDARCFGNLIVNAGKDFVVDRLQTAPAVMDYQAIGTGTNAAAAGDTTLQTENARVQGTLSQPTSTTDRLVTTFGAGVGTGAITETGRLNASSSGTLLARQVFSVVNKGSGDSLQTTHDITVL